MAKIVLVTVTIGALYVSGCCCCRYWYQQGTSFNECKQDRTNCLCELKKYADMDSIGCYETGYMKRCMKSKGYRLVSEGKLPDDVKREDPHMTTFWLLAGVSGTLEPGQ